MCRCKIHTLDRSESGWTTLTSWSNLGSVTASLWPAAGREATRVWMTCEVYALLLFFLCIHLSFLYIGWKS